MIKYTVTIVIPCTEETKLEVWSKFAKFGYHTNYYEGYATLTIRDKTIDEVLESIELATTYDGHQVKLVKSK